MNENDMRNEMSQDSNEEDLWKYINN